MANSNGTAGVPVRQDEQYAARELSMAQREHLMMLVGQMNTTHAEMEAARQAHETATANANSFLAYCAKEHGTNALPWRFEQEQMRFVYEPVPEDGSNGRVIEGASHVT